MHYPLRPEWRFATEHSLLQGGRVNLICVDEIKSVAGTRWPKLQESIYARLEGLSRQRLGPNDFFMQMDETNFLVTTPSASKDESLVFCMRIAHELRTSLLGQCEVSQLRIGSASAIEGDTLQCEPVPEAELERLAPRAGISRGRARSNDGLECAAAAQSVEAELTHSFVPLWDVENQAIIGYRCLTDSISPEAKCLSHQAKLKRDLAAALARIRCATTALGEHLSKGERFFVSIPIAYDVIGAPIVRMEVTSLCRGLPAMLRPYLLFSITELPYGVPQSRLSDLVASLRPFCRGVSAQLPARIPSYRAYLDVGLCAIGLSLAPHLVDSTEMDSEIFKLWSAARSLPMRSYVVDVASLDVLRSARQKGVACISGPIIARPLKAPAPIARLSYRDIAVRAEQEGRLNGWGLQAVAG